MNSPAVSAKPELRRVYRARRNALQGKQREKMDFDLNQRLLEQATGWGDGSILAFWPNDGEPDLRVALTQLSESGTTIGLPVLERENGKSMSFRQWLPGELMTPNWFGIPEPRDGRSCSLEDAAVVLMPLVAFDRNGTRLGMGGGYYDRVLKPIQDADSPLRIGIAYSLQQAPRLPRDEWDVPLHAVVTEKAGFTLPR